MFIQRLWRSVKSEEVYLQAYRDGTEARRQLSAYFDFYNRQHGHQSLDCSITLRGVLRHARGHDGPSGLKE